MADETGGAPANTEGAANTEAKTVLNAGNATSEQKPETGAPASEGKEAAPDQTKQGTEDQKSDAKGDDKAKVPDTYADFKMPEGVTVDKAALEAATPMFKELGLTQDQAQKLVDFYAGNQAKALENQSKVWAETQDKWVADAKSDKEFGGDKFDENIAVANKALKAFGTPELTKALALTGAGNHPEFIRLMVRVGKQIGEDKLVTGGNATGGAKDPAEILFGSKQS